MATSGNNGRTEYFLDSESAKPYLAVFRYKNGRTEYFLDSESAKPYLAVFRYKTDLQELGFE